MDISKHISSLLYEHECVIVPGLGGFVSNYAPAKIHPVQHLFQPPSKTILFNPGLKNNDGLLINAIAGQENISYPDALAVVEEFSKKTFATIKSGGRVELSNIGVLYTGIEGNILFRQDEKNNYLKDAYGLSSFVSPMIGRKYRRPAQKPVTKFINRRETAKPGKTRRIGTWALVLLPLFIVLGWISLNTRMWNDFINGENNLAEATKSEQSIEATLNNLTIDGNNKTVVQPKSFDEKHITFKPETASFVPEMSIEEPIVKTKDDAINTSTAPERVPDPVVPPVQAASQKMYHLIGGSFEIIANAEILISSCKEQGYKDSKVIGQAANGFYRVSISAYARKSEAITELQKVRATLNPNAWLLKQ
jgi:cell division septation protein DedD